MVRSSFSRRTVRTRRNGVGSRAYAEVGTLGLDGCVVVDDVDWFDQLMGVRGI
jgi:hypothetical protein